MSHAVDVHDNDDERHRNRAAQELRAAVRTENLKPGIRVKAAQERAADRRQTRPGRRWYHGVRTTERLLGLRARWGKPLIDRDQAVAERRLPRFQRIVVEQGD